MCGIVGIAAQPSETLGNELYEALQVLQHRGQDAAGIATWSEGRFRSRKGMGLVRDVFRGRDIQGLGGSLGLAHTRYPTAGAHRDELVQPIFANAPAGLALVHNGNLINRAQLIEELRIKDMRYVDSGSDSDVLLNVFASELTRELHGRNRGDLNPERVFRSLDRTLGRCHGAYAAAMIIEGGGLVGFRDPRGIRPLLLGVRKNGAHDEYMLTSENVALSMLGFELVRDIDPGEAVFIDCNGRLHSHRCSSERSFTPCLFEYIYFARPDAILNGISVYRMRMGLGRRLARTLRKRFPDQLPDIVIPIPESSVIAAMETARALGVPYREGFIKNRYIGRTFIMPNQPQRRTSVRRKLATLNQEFKGRHVLLVDDSIVRGTTSKEVVRMAREAGAGKVWFASAAPPVRYPNVFGIDMPYADQLVASREGTDAGVCDFIGADALIYQTLEDTLDICRELNGEIEHYEDSVFTGDYREALITEDYLNDLGRERARDTGEQLQLI
ncbi:MAG: amidophosphoribosyltransferase [Gammaproteobacteria bacterium AqS3]|nr:amidophosphoribosyltransferase [Gammaproteobacteria bacterium AqS3]